VWELTPKFPMSAFKGGNPKTRPLKPQDRTPLLFLRSVVSSPLNFFSPQRGLRRMSLILSRSRSVDSTEQRGSSDGVSSLNSSWGWCRRLNRGKKSPPQKEWGQRGGAVCRNKRTASAGQARTLPEKKGQIVRENHYYVARTTSKIKTSLMLGSLERLSST